MVKRRNYVILYAPKTLRRNYGTSLCKACEITTDRPTRVHCPGDNIGYRRCINLNEQCFDNTLHDILATIDKCYLKGTNLCRGDCDSCIVNVIITNRHFKEDV